jgi:hypothetical protein
VLMWRIDSRTIFYSYFWIVQLIRTIKRTNFRGRLWIVQLIWAIQKQKLLWSSLSSVDFERSMCENIYGRLRIVQMIWTIEKLCYPWHPNSLIDLSHWKIARPLILCWSKPRDGEEQIHHEHLRDRNMNVLWKRPCAVNVCLAGIMVLNPWR